MKGVMVLCLALVSAPATAADQFDLVCVGSAKYRPGARAEPVTYRYRIDLTAGNWCRGDCRTVEKIQLIEAGRLVFSEEEDKLSNRAIYRHEIDRLTGEWIEIDDNPRSALGLYLNISGKCEPADFSGLPAPKF